MPSSLIFAGLVVLWLLILAPAVARHRQEVARPSVAALSGRVLERPRHPRRNLEVIEVDEDRSAVTTRAVRVPAARSPADHGDDHAWLQPPPRYRPGRGGYDPEAAALAASARYAVRQRVVLGLLISVVVTAVVAAVAMPGLWWVHGAVDLALVGYLVYLRRQVRMEEAIRERRAARVARRSRRGGARDEWRRADRHAADDLDGRFDERDDFDDEHDDLDDERDAHRVGGAGEPLGMLPARPRGADATRSGEPVEPEPALPRLQPAPPPPLPPGTALVEADDEDPELEELDRSGRRDYRRAAGQ